MMSDVCCQHCRTNLGICMARHGCTCHIKARKADESDHRSRQLFPDPTGDEAVRNVMREQRQPKPKAATGRLSYLKEATK